MHMTTQEETYKVTVHLINGTKFRVQGAVPASTLMDVYKILGRTDGGRVKFPTSSNVHQFLPASSVLRIEAKGVFL